jgi:hypothetical protein
MQFRSLVIVYSRCFGNCFRTPGVVPSSAPGVRTCTPNALLYVRKLTRGLFRSSSDFILWQMAQCRVKIKHSEFQVARLPSLAESSPSNKLYRFEHTVIQLNLSYTYDQCASWQFLSRRECCLWSRISPRRRAWWSLGAIRGETKCSYALWCTAFECLPRGILSGHEFDGCQLFSMHFTCRSNAAPEIYSQTKTAQKGCCCCCCCCCLL